MDILTNPQLAVEANSLFGFLAYFLYHVVVVGLAAFCVIALIVVVALTQFPRKATPRLRIISEFSRGRWFLMTDRDMLQGIVDELNSVHGEGTYWLEYK